MFFSAKEAEVPAPEATQPSKPLTSKDILASIPGFPVKHRKRSSKKISFAEQLKQMRDGFVDVESPDSILCIVDIKSLVNNNTFSLLPGLYQQKLVQLLPEVDRTSATILPDGTVQLNSSALNNEFFARACELWKEKLAKGEFTPEFRQKIKAEREKDRNRLDPWKLKNFEPIWGCKSEREPTPPRPPIKTIIRVRSTSNSCTRKSQNMKSISGIRQKGKCKRSSSQRERKSLKKPKLAEPAGIDIPSTSEFGEGNQIVNVTPAEEDQNIEVVEVSAPLEEQTQEADTPSEKALETAEKEFPSPKEEAEVVMKEDEPEPTEGIVEFPSEEFATSPYPLCAELQAVASGSEAEELIGPIIEAIKREEEADVPDIKQEGNAEALKLDSAIQECDINIMGAGLNDEKPFESEMEEMNILEEDEENYILEENSLADASEVMKALCIHGRVEGEDLLQVAQSADCWDVDSTENLLNESETDETLALDWGIDDQEEAGELSAVQLFQDFSKLDIGVQLTEPVATESLVSSTVGTSQGFVEPPPVTTSPPATIACSPSAVSTAAPSPMPSTSGIQKIATSTIPAAPANTGGAKPKATGKEKGGRYSRSASNKPPPGAVNLERSYQICQAVIQSSPNREQLEAQLKPPPSMLASAVTGAAAKRGEGAKKSAASATQQGAATSSKTGESSTGRRASERLKKKGPQCYNFFDYF